MAAASIATARRAASRSGCRSNPHRPFVVPRVLPAPRDRDGTGRTTSRRSAEPFETAAGQAELAGTAAASAQPRPVGHAEVAPVAEELGAPPPRGERPIRTGGGRNAARGEDSRRIGGGGDVATAARRRPEVRFGCARGGDDASFDARGAAAGSAAAAATAAVKLPGKETKWIEEKDIEHQETQRKRRHSSIPVASVTIPVCIPPVCTPSIAEKRQTRRTGCSYKDVTAYHTHITRSRTDKEHNHAQTGGCWGGGGGWGQWIYIRSKETNNTYH